MKFGTIMITVGVLLVASAADVKADLGSRAAREAVEYLLKKFGKEVAEEGAEKLAGRIAKAATRHGDDIFAAVRKVGPKAMSLADEAGENAPRVMSLLTRHGDHAARVLSRPKGMALFARYGDDAASVMMKHHGIAEPLLENLGAPAVKALGAVGPQAGRRMAMMAQGGELAALGHTPEVMGVIAKYGDPAMAFIWKNKGPLAVGTALTAFLADPEPFIDGTNQLTNTVAENVVKPVVQDVVKPVVQETAHAVSSLIWTLILLVGGTTVCGGYLVCKHPQLAAGLGKAALAAARR